MVDDYLHQLKNSKLNKSSVKGKDYSSVLHVDASWNVDPKKAIISQQTEQMYKNTLSWLISEFKKIMRIIPKRILLLSIFGGIILGVNLIFWTIEPYFLPNYLQPFRTLFSTVVFLTATYNDVIPKTIFWVILFTFGRRLFFQVRKRGFKNTFACLKKTIPMLKETLTRLEHKAYPILLAGAGFGLIIANNFSSYSRFSGARNKFDKYFIVIVIAFTITYLLGEAKKSGIFKLLKYTSKDIGKLIGKPSGLSDDGVYCFLSGFVIGLILDAPIILVQSMYGGYLLGIAALVVSIVLMFVNQPKQVRGNL